MRTMGKKLKLVMPKEVLTGRNPKTLGNEVFRLTFGGAIFSSLWVKNEVAERNHTFKIADVGISR